MIRETLNTLTIKHCFKVFTWIEGKAQRLVPKNKDPNRSTLMRNLALLRGLNDPLKRVSKSTKIGLSACVQFFISALFPSSERSVVNLCRCYRDPWSGPPSYAEGKAALLAADSEASSKKDDDDKMMLDTPIHIIYGDVTPITFKSRSAKRYEAEDTSPSVRVAGMSSHLE